jgi:hypothetical protein
VRPSRPEPALRAIPAILAGLLLTGCQLGSTGLSEEKLEETLADQVTEEVGTAPDEIDCPGGLDGENGATQTCTLRTGTDELDVEVEVTSVEGDTVNFDWEVLPVDDGS